MQRRRKLAQTTTKNQENKRKMLLVRKGVSVYKPCFYACCDSSNFMNHNTNDMWFINWDKFVLKKFEHECARKISWEKANKATVASFQTIDIRPVPEKLSIKENTGFKLIDYLNDLTKFVVNSDMHHFKTYWSSKDLRI